MRYLIQFFIIQLIVLFSFSGSLLALGKGIAMGSMTSVVSDGPFDAAKNPALLARQERNQAFGIVLKYLAYSTNDVSLEANVSGSGLDADTENLEKRNMGCFLAYSVKLGKPVIGFALTDKGNGQYFLSENKTVLKVDIYESIIKADVEEYNPVFHSSIGFDISDKSSIGLQATVKYSKKKNVENKRDLVSSVDRSLVTEDSNINILSYTIGAGYLYRERDTQLGLLFYIGEFSWRKQELSYSFKDSDFPAPDPVDDSSSDSESYSSSVKYTEGMKFIAGGYHRLNTFLSIAIEGEFWLGSSYTVTELELYEDTDNDIYDIVQRRSIVTNNNSILLKAGAEINPIRSFSLMFGCAFTSLRGRSSDINGNGFFSSKYGLYLITAGVSYQYNKDISAYFGSLIIRSDAEAEIGSNDSSNGFFLNSDATEMDAILSAGIIYTF